MTASLFGAALIATVLDVASYLLFIVPGTLVRDDGSIRIVREANALVAPMTTPAALIARACALVALGALVIAASEIDRRSLTTVVRLAAAIAIVVGVLGLASNLGAIA